MVTPMVTKFYRDVGGGGLWRRVVCVCVCVRVCVGRQNKCVHEEKHQTRFTMCLLLWISLVLQLRKRSSRIHETRDQFHREQHVLQYGQLDRNRDTYG